MVENDSTLSETAVFEENYALLCNTITNTDVLPLIEDCTKEKIFTAEEEKIVAAIDIPPEKLQYLLLHISSTLKAGNTRSFYIMVKIMKKHGSKGIQTLANHIMNRLKISSEILSQICSNVHLQDDEPKGNKIIVYYYLVYLPTVNDVYYNRSSYVTRYVFIHNHVSNQLLCWTKFWLCSYICACTTVATSVIIALVIKYGSNKL